VPNAMSSILRAATRGKESPLNILTVSTHERYCSICEKLPHNFYAYCGQGLKDWNTDYAPIPSNYTILQPQYIPPDIDIDILLSQNKFGQFPLFREMSSKFKIPLISLEHTLPVPAWDEYQTASISQMRGHINVFLSEYSAKAWGWNDDYIIIPPGIDTDLFTPIFELPTEPVIMSVVNDWINRDWACGFRLWREVTNNLTVQVFGDTPGLSKAAPSIEYLIDAYRQARVFLNTSLVSTCPFTLLEAMACGACPVSTATTMIPQVIEDGVNGFISNDPKALRSRCIELLNNPELARQMGRKARETVVEKFSFHQMAAKWNDVFELAARVVVK